MAPRAPATVQLTCPEKYLIQFMNKHCLRGESCKRMFAQSIFIGKYYKGWVFAEKRVGRRRRSTIKDISYSDDLS